MGGCDGCIDLRIKDNKGKTNGNLSAWKVNKCTTIIELTDQSRNCCPMMSISETTSLTILFPSLYFFPGLFFTLFSKF